LVLAFVLAILHVAALSLEEQLGSGLVNAVRAAAAAAAQAGVDAEVNAEVEAEVQGVQNCQNKCQNMFNNLQYTINTQGGDTNEYLACLAGCDICSQSQSANDTDWTTCFDTCKNTDWLQAIDPTTGQPAPIVKGVIEPDKACEMGCVINLCQVTCQGGTTDMNPTPTNAPAWWGSGVGCSIKTGAIRPGGYYSQNSQYNYYNAPQGSGGQTECCAQAYSLCNYPPNAIAANQVNYNNVLGQAQKFCSNVPGAGNTQTSICAYWSNPTNCGSTLS